MAAEFTGNRKQGGLFGAGNNMAKKGALTKRKKKYEEEELARKNFLTALAKAEKIHNKKFWDLVLDKCYEGDDTLLRTVAMKMMPEIVKPSEQESGNNIIVMNYSDLMPPAKKGKK